jgi:pyruvate kinase
MMKHSIRRTKIVCTLGPSSETRDKITRLVKQGMNIARLNFSHGTWDQKQNSIKIIRKIAEEQRVVISILADLQGPKIRVGTMKDGSQKIAKGDIVELSSDQSIEGTGEVIPVDYDKLAEDADIGDKILIDDGRLELKVTEKQGTEVKARVVVGGEVKSRKGVNLPGVNLSMPSLTSKDIDDLEFAVSRDVDYIAMSFVRSADDIKDVLSRLRELDSEAGIIAKIEKPEALNNIHEIIEASDGLMVARGDLGIETPSEQVPLEQKNIIHLSRRAGKPVITATQMLESMIYNPRATRAENSDVANAVFDGTDAIMLSGESAVGKYPVAAVQTMDRISRTIEENAPRLYDDLAFKKPEWKKIQIAESVANSVVSLARHVDANVIGTLTQSGSTARRIAKYRPRVPIFAFTENKKVCNQLALVWGVTPILIKAHPDTDRSIRLMEQKLQELGMLNDGNRAILTTGMPVAEKGRTNMIKVSTGDTMASPKK